MGVTSVSEEDKNLGPSYIAENLKDVATMEDSWSFLTKLKDQHEYPCIHIYCSYAHSIISHNSNKVGIQMSIRWIYKMGYISTNGIPFSNEKEYSIDTCTV